MTRARASRARAMHSSWRWCVEVEVEVLMEFEPFLKYVEDCFFCFCLYPFCYIRIVLKFFPEIIVAMRRISEDAVQIIIIYFDPVMLFFKYFGFIVAVAIGCKAHQLARIIHIAKTIKTGRTIQAAYGMINSGQFYRCWFSIESHFCKIFINGDQLLPVEMIKAIFFAIHTRCKILGRYFCSFQIIALLIGAACSVYYHHIAGIER